MILQSSSRTNAVDALEFTQHRLLSSIMLTQLFQAFYPPSTEVFIDDFVDALAYAGDFNLSLSTREDHIGMIGDGLSGISKSTGSKAITTTGVIAADLS